MRSEDELEEWTDDDLLAALYQQGRPYEPPLCQEAKQRELIHRLGKLEKFDLSLN